MKKKTGKFHNFIIKTFLVINILLTIVYLCSAFGGYGKPEHLSYLPLLVLSYPITVILNLLFGIAWLFVKKRYSLISFISIAVTLPQFLTFSPFNFNRFNKEKNSAGSYTLMTYNVYDLRKYSEADGNYGIEEIIKYDPDFVCMQEVWNAENIKDVHGISDRQVKILQKRYPYRGGFYLGFYSKHPTQFIESFKDDKYFCYEIYQTKIHEHDTYIINMHLESIGLTDSDKELYLELTNIKDKKKTIRGVRSQLMRKLKHAFVNRQNQSHLIKNAIDSLTQVNPKAEIIACGDFNDTPYSYSYRTIKGDFFDAYSEAGIGPVYTYNADRFFFRIDHIFYNGKNLEAVSTRRGKDKASDHYPLITVFKERNY